ncbi:hypothetical protein MTO96_032645 [Rhipicephalus appendiculatus]
MLELVQRALVQVTTHRIRVNNSPNIDKRDKRNIILVQAGKVLYRRALLVTERPYLAASVVIECQECQTRLWLLRRSDPTDAVRLLSATNDSSRQLHQKQRVLTSMARYTVVGVEVTPKRMRTSARTEQHGFGLWHVGDALTHD